MKTETFWTIPGTNLKKSKERRYLEAFARSLGMRDAEAVAVHVDMLETGDRVAVEICRKTSETDDGIVTGGQWVKVTGTFTRENDSIGFLLDDNGQPVQTIATDMTDAFPYRRARITQPESPTPDNAPAPEPSLSYS